MTVWLSPEEQAVWVPFVLGTMNLFARLDAELKEHFDITHLDYGLLAQMSAAPDQRLRMSVLADQFGVDPSVITYRVRRMEDRGLVRREAVEEDGRGIWAVLEAEGQRLLDRAAPVHVQSVRRLFMDQIDCSVRPALAEAFTSVRSVQTET